MTWYQRTFTDDEVIKGLHTQALGDFNTATQRAGFPAGLALFNLRFDIEQITPVVYYLPPVAEKFCPQLLQNYSFQVCEIPDRAAISVLSGRGTDLDIWFTS